MATKLRISQVSESSFAVTTSPSPNKLVKTNSEGKIDGSLITSSPKLDTARKIAISGAAIGNASFDGTQDIDIVTTMGDVDASKITSGIVNIDRIPSLTIAKIPSSVQSQFSISGEQITSGTIPLDRIPKGALERLVVVANETARYALTTSQVQVGDTVKQADTGFMYYVVDDGKLNNASGYELYNSGSAVLADSAKKLASSVTINGVAFTGESDVTIEDSTKLPLSGGNMTGSIMFPTPTNNTLYWITNSAGESIYASTVNAANLTTNGTPGCDLMLTSSKGIGFSNAANSNTTVAIDVTSGNISSSGAITASGTITGATVVGAVYNDYADCLKVREGESIQYGKAYQIKEDGFCYLVDMRNAPNTVGIASETYSMQIGYKDSQNNLPIAVSGFVLAYTDKTYPSGTRLVSNEKGILTEAKEGETPIAMYMYKETEELYGFPEVRQVYVNGRSWVKVL